MEHAEDKDTLAVAVAVDDQKSNKAGVKTKIYSDTQHEQTLVEAFTAFPVANFWCLYMFFICILWGYDGLSGAAVISMTAFRETYGYVYEGGYVISAAWQLGFTGISFVGLVFGGATAGLLVKRYGRRVVISSAYILTVGGVFLQFFGNTPPQFLGGKLLTGIPLGIFTTVAPTYASEVAPFRLRGAITAGTNFSIALGQLVAQGVMRQTQLINGPRSYQILFSVQWGFAALGLLVLPFLPESPFLLVSQNKIDAARKNMTRLYGAGYDVDTALANIQTALHEQQQESQNQGTMLECFSCQNIKRTLCSTMMFFIQNATGQSWVSGYMTYFMELGGLPATKAFDTSVGITGMMVVGNMFGWVSVEWLGRRGSALYGVMYLAVCLLLIGVFSCVNTSWAIWTQVVFMALWAFGYQATIGSVAWPIAAENPTSSLRTPTQALTVITNGLSGCIWGFALPYAVNPDEGNLGGKIAFVFGATLVIAAVWIYFMVPETKGLTYVEIDELWKTTAPRNWKKTPATNATASEDRE
ncbi:hypothetical protein SEUCBS139899_009640 [Sporothrix eucalyptigena]|uniref:Major facilitator superfamily (MFS) profile domain-containing protein n=1 Tax=Sporothrix eucalyptigena TaxID=1812306 RepID=A0ABP0C3I9_9PEZI